MEGGSRQLNARSKSAKEQVSKGSLRLCLQHISVIMQGGSRMSKLDYKPAAHWHYVVLACVDVCKNESDMLVQIAAGNVFASTPLKLPSDDPNTDT